MFRVKTVIVLVAAVALLAAGCFSTTAGVKGAGTVVVEERDWYIFGLSEKDHAEECANGLQYFHSEQSGLDIVISIGLMMVAGLGLIVQSRTVEYQCRPDVAG